MTKDLSDDISEDSYLNNKRTIFSLNNDGIDYNKFSIGFILYFIIFILVIPYFLIKNNYWNILSAYFPNLDLLATLLGYHGGPMNTFIWKHIYNPADSTLVGYLSSNIINLFALLGVTYIIAYYTFINKNIYKGWSRAFIMLPMTYFIPGNFVVYIMNIFGNYLNKFLLSKSLLHYIITIMLGFMVSLCFILSEAYLIEHVTPLIVHILKIFTF